VEFLFQACAAVGGTILVCQFLLSLIGLGGEHGDHGDMAGHGHDHGHAGGDDHASTWMFGVVTLRTVTAALVFFGLTGMAALRAEAPALAALLLATVAGLGAFYVVSWIMAFLPTLNVDGTVDIYQTHRCLGKVLVAIPGARQGRGKVLVEVANRLLEYRAETPGEPLPAGTPIYVAEILSDTIVEVVALSPAPPPLPRPGGSGAFIRHHPQE
jgi:hypothetical protein